MGSIRVAGREATVGRNPSSTVAVADPFISRTHARLRRVAGGWELSVAPRVTHEGLVRHNDQPVRSGSTVRLRRGDRLVFGRSPVYRVELDGSELALHFADETEQAAPSAPSRPALAFHPPGPLPRSLRDSFAAAGDLAELPPDAPMDAAAVLAPRAAAVAARLQDLRARRFFLPIGVLGDPVPRADALPFPLVGSAYLLGSPRDPELARRLVDLVESSQGAARAALPFRTGEILYVDAAGGRVLAHDWTRGGPRELRLSELQHQMVLCLAEAQRETPGLQGLPLPEVLRRLEARRWARSERTVANELSVRIPHALRAAGLHPDLYQASGTREKVYGLSTPPSCLREA